MPARIFAETPNYRALGRAVTGREAFRWHFGPMFYRGRLWAYLSNTGHWPDTGGAVPGGFSTRATEVQQEGLRLPPVKLFRAGVMDDDILQIVLANIRVPEERIGDIKAQVAALTVGERRLTALLDRYGADTVAACIRELRRRSEQMMRAHIAKIPDGVYRGEAFVDSDGVGPDPLAIRLTMKKEGTDLHFDFSESSPPCRGPLNSVIATTKAAVYLAIKHVFPDVPINAGCFAPLHIADPHGTFLYARYPRPVSGCAAEVSSRIAESVFTTLAHAIPESMKRAFAVGIGLFLAFIGLHTSGIVVLGAPGAPVHVGDMTDPRFERALEQYLEEQRLSRRRFLGRAGRLAHAADFDLHAGCPGGFLDASRHSGAPASGTRNLPQPPPHLTSASVPEVLPPRVHPGNQTAARSGLAVYARSAAPWHANRS